MVPPIDQVILMKLLGPSRFVDLRLQYHPCISKERAHDLINGMVGLLESLLSLLLGLFEKQVRDAKSLDIWTWLISLRKLCRLSLP